MNVKNRDTIIIGGGVIGLSIAYELSKRNRSVVLLERDKIGQQSSWVGAGIFPPANKVTAIHPLEKMSALSSELHQLWADELHAITGIDTGYSRCGGLYLARTNGELAALSGEMQHWHDRQISFEELDKKRLEQFVPQLNIVSIKKTVFVADESQIRSPRHLQALAAACRINGVEIKEECQDIALIDLEKGNGKASIDMLVDDQQWIASNVCVACGAWSEQLLKPHGITLPSVPVRGQMALFKLDSQLFTPVINEGSRYLVPRNDGYVLAGATVEEVGFDVSTNPADIESLKRWANSIIPELDEASFVKSWAGLRPGTYDGFPYLGSIEQNENLFVATGHFKSGLHLSTATAVIMSELLCGDSSDIDISPFAPSRVNK